jgi:hypothetical protein
MKEKVNPYEFIYEKEQVIGINANALLSFMSFLEMVIDKEPNIGALLVYPKAVKEIKDDKDELLKVDIEWKEHNPNSFFFTASEETGAVPIMTDMALRANQLLYGLTKIHEENINKGIAKKQDDKGVFKA